MKKGLIFFLSVFLVFQSFGKDLESLADSTKPKRNFHHYDGEDNHMMPDSTRAKKKLHHYISVNTTFFIKQLFNFSGSTVSVISSPYVFEYKMLCGNNGFRFDAGGSLSQKKTFSDSSQVLINNAQTFDFRAGYVYQRKLAKRWEFFGGADIIAEYANTSSRTNTAADVVANNNKGYTIGFGPSFGIQFNITNRVGLFTESAIYYNYNHQNISTTSFNFPELNTSSKTISNNIQFLIPTSLYFFVKF